MVLFFFWDQELLPSEFNRRVRTDTHMVVHKTFSRGGRVKITVEQPPTQPALQPDRLQAENENLR